MLKYITFVAEQGANIKKALEEFSWLPCCCHILYVVLSRTFKLQQELAEIETRKEELFFKKVELNYLN